MSNAYDVVVCGGGFRGVGAAVRLVSQGLKVLVVEPRPSVGWEAAWCLNLELPHGAAGFAGELAARLDAVGGRRDGRIDAPITEIVLAQILLEKKIDLLHYVQVFGARVAGKQLAALSLAGKSGQFDVRARAFVDATEQGTLLRMCGAEVVPPTSSRSVYSFMMAFVDDSSDLPSRISSDGLDIHLSKGMWTGEAQLSYVVDSSDIGKARGMLPRVLELIRSRVPALKNAMVATTANAVTPLDCCRMSGGPGVKNLFACGPWQEQPISFENRAQRIAGRVALGEKVADEIGEVIGTLKLKDDMGSSASSIQPPDLKAEVVVCGGGTAGVFAAIAAARNGADTLLVEASSCLGGIGTGGAIHYYYHGIKGGLQDEVDAKVEELTPLFTGGRGVSGFQPEVKKIVLQRMCDEAGVRVAWETFACGVETEEVATSAVAKKGDRADRQIRSVILADANGQRRAETRTVVDCTGDADVAALAGCAYTYGRPTDGLAHAYSQPAGFLSDTGLSFYNFDAGYCDPTDSWDLTRARREGYLRYLRNNYEEKQRLLYIAPLIGLRNSRQVVGDYRLTLLDEIRCAEFPDAIAYSYSHLDNHASDYENESDEVMLWVWGLGNWQTYIGSEIPYRSLLPKGVEGLLVACRALSMDNDAHYQLRMQRDLQRLGEVAGIAAAIAAKSKTTPRGIKVEQLQQRLAEVGALSHPESGYHYDGWKPEGLFSKNPKSLEAGSIGGALKLLAERAAAAADQSSKLTADDPKVRFDAAVTLALAKGSDAAFRELEACARERRSVATTGAKSVPGWNLAVALLGVCQRAEAVPDIEAILDDGASDLRALTLAVRALGRIGQKSSVKAIEKLLSRKDLRLTETLQISCGGGVAASVEDSAWKLELAAVDALRSLGVDRRDIAERLLEDPRGFVKRCARHALDKF